MLARREKGDFDPSVFSSCVRERNVKVFSHALASEVLVFNFQLPMRYIFRQKMKKKYNDKLSAYPIEDCVVSTYVPVYFVKRDLKTSHATLCSRL